MRVREDDNRYWQLLNMLVHQFKCSASGVFAGERINDYPTTVSANERDIRNVIAAHLPYIFSNLEQSVMCIQRCVSPQLRVNRLRAITTIAKEFIIIAISYEATLLIGDQTIFALGNKTLAHSRKIYWINISISSIVVMQLRMGCRLLWLFGSHFLTLVIAH